jgi:Peptidase M15
VGDLSQNFSQSEFEKDCPIPAECVPILRRLVVEVVEPVRAFCRCPLEITSGYRPPDANAAAHGQPNSEHIYSAVKAACDFVTPNNSPTARAVFDWMRNNPTLPYHQLILEHGQVSTVIHVSINSEMPGVRSVLEGATHNSVPYIKIEHVDYATPSNNEAVQTASAEG